MTTAIMIATAQAAGSEGPAALLRYFETTLIARLAHQLRESGASGFVVLTRPEWTIACAQALGDAGIEADVRDVKDVGDGLRAVSEAAEAASGDVVVTQADILVHTGGVKGLLADPRVSTGILVRGWKRRDTGWGTRVERGRVVSVESPFHQVNRPNARFLGMVRVGGGDRARLVDVARRTAALCREEPPQTWEPELAHKVQAWGKEFFAEHAAGVALAEQLERRPDARWLPEPAAVRREVDDAFAARVLARAEAARFDVTALLVTALVRSDVMMRCAYLRDLFWAQPFSQQAAAEARSAMALIDEEKVLMDSAVKANDGFFGTFFCSPYTRYIARWAAKRGIRPNQVTVFSFLLGLASAAAFAVGGDGWLIGGAILLYFTLAFDCVDGQLARYSKRFTTLGAWLDPMFDRWKEYGAYAGLAYGAVRHGADPASIWLLAGATMTLQTVRHLADFSYGIGQAEVIASIKKVPIEEPRDVHQPRATRGGEEDLEGDEAGDLDESAESHDPVPVRRVKIKPAGSGVRARLRYAVRRVGAAGIAASRSAESTRWLVWVKRIIAFPIGERYAAIAIAAAIGGPRTVFVVMLAWGAFSAAYTLTGRTLRSVM